MAEGARKLDGLDEAARVAELQASFDRAKAYVTERAKRIAAQEEQERNRARVRVSELLADLQVTDGLPSQAELDRREKERREKERRDMHRARFFRAAPVRFADDLWNGDLPEPTVSQHAAQHWVAGDRRQHIMFRGGVGCGKSTASALILLVLTEFPHRYGGSVWLKPDDFTSAVLHSYDENAPRLARNIVLDDIGRETKAGFVEAWCQILESRDHTLIMSTNLTREQIRERYDERIVTRLGDTTLVIDDPGPNLRTRGGF